MATGNNANDGPRDNGCCVSHDVGKVDDLRSFIDTIKRQSAREFLCVEQALSGDWQLAAITTALVKKMRMPVIEYQHVQGSDMPVVHNVCASLSRIAKSCRWTVPELEQRLASAYQQAIEPVVVEDGPVRENVLIGEQLDLSLLPSVRYTETETHPYISAAQLVARDPESGSLNVSFHRMMITGKNTLTLYMTPGGHLHRIFELNALEGKNTTIAAFIGAHPLWSLGALASGSPDLNELSVIGGLLGYALPVVVGLQDKQLLIPAFAEIVLEGELSCVETAVEGPYGEAFGFVSNCRERPVFTVSSLSHRNNAIFQDIVPAQLEHLTMTGVAIQVSLKKYLLETFSCVTGLFLPAPMTVYVSVTKNIERGEARIILTEVLMQQRFVKQLVLFDDTVDITNSKQTLQAIATQVQADRDVVLVPSQVGNGLDPSERDGLTTKWGVDASSYGKYEVAPLKNKLPEAVVEALDIAEFLGNSNKCH